jgi:hypothetical protein
LERRILAALNTDHAAAVALLNQRIREREQHTPATNYEGNRP